MLNAHDSADCEYACAERAVKSTDRPGLLVRHLRTTSKAVYRRDPAMDSSQIVVEQLNVTSSDLKG
jgi:hypothetical protein